MKNKTIIVRFTFTQEEWSAIKKYYNESEIRQILLIGGEGELDQLLQNKELDSPPASLSSLKGMGE